MKSYNIINVVVDHPTAGKLNKKNIVYYTDGVEDFREFYADGMEIRPEYKDKMDISKIDIDTITPQELQKLANKLKPLLK